jgi:hypothetical protein
MSQIGREFTMFKRRAVLIIMIILLSLGLVTAGMAAASQVSELTRSVQQGEMEDPYLELVSEMTGMQASLDSGGEDCLFDPGYEVYLCSPPAPENTQQADPARKNRLWRCSRIPVCWHPGFDA